MNSTREQYQKAHQIARQARRQNSHRWNWVYRHNCYKAGIPFGMQFLVEKAYR